MYCTYCITIRIKLFQFIVVKPSVLENELGIKLRDKNVYSHLFFHLLQNILYIQCCVCPVYMYVQLVLILYTVFSDKHTVCMRYVSFVVCCILHAATKC